MQRVDALDVRKQMNKPNILVLDFALAVKPSLWHHNMKSGTHVHGCTSSFES